MATLTNPNLQLGEVICGDDGNPIVDDDGRVTRNDGGKLTPAEQNPWYVLMTIYGEPKNLFDAPLIDKNRRAWNAWACQDMDDDYRAELAKKMGLDVTELSAWPRLESDVLERFTSRLGKNIEFPKIKSILSLSNSHFSHAVLLEKFIFVDWIDFENSTFTSEVDFRASAFFGFVDFSNSTFTNRAIFDGCTFSDWSNFSSCVFVKLSRFKGSTFTSPVKFTNTIFRDQTVFAYANFEKATPQFYQTVIHQDTSFTIDPANWPAIKAENSKAYLKQNKDAYGRLRHIMNELQRPDEEQFFYRQEMGCKAELEPWRNAVFIRAYGALSDYGYSIWLPLGWGLLMTMIFWLFYISVPESLANLQNYEPNASPYWSAMGLSFANTFGGLGFGRFYFGDLIKAFPVGLKLAVMLQTILGIGCLFLFGLGLRARFRLR